MLDMTPSPWFWTFLKTTEQFRPTAYKPTRHDVWTVGYGHTHGVQPGDTCTMEQGLAYLQADVAWAIRAVNDSVGVPLSQAQFDALCSLVFNIGADAFTYSTLLDDLNRGDYAAAADQFLSWDHQDGEVLEGLRLRREAERARFLKAA